MLYYKYVFNLVRKLRTTFKKKQTKLIVGYG